MFSASAVELGDGETGVGVVLGFDFSPGVAEPLTAYLLIRIPSARAVVGAERCSGLIVRQPSAPFGTIAASPIALH